MTIPTQPDINNERPMPVIPHEFAPYKRTPVFTHDSIPASLLKDHSTAQHTWAQINIESGTLIYGISEPGHEGVYRLTPDNAGVITPEHAHYIKAEGDVSFYIEFYRRSS